MNDEKLIETVKKYPAIYDMSHPKYMDNKYKLELWKKIGSEINLSDAKCKSRWQNIRDHFRKYVLKRNRRNGQAANNIRKYKYEQTLNFLLPYFNRKESSSDIISYIQTIEDVPGSETTNDTVKPGDRQNEQPSSCKETDRDEQRKRVCSDSVTSSATVTPSGSRELLKSKANDDVIDAFLLGIASTLKKFSQFNQHLAKGKIFAIIQEIELKEMQERYSFSSNVPSAGRPSSASVSPLQMVAGQAVNEF